MTDTIKRVILVVPPDYSGPRQLDRVDAVREDADVDQPQLRREEVYQFPAKPLGRDEISEQTKQAYHDASTATEKCDILYEIMTGEQP